MKTKSTNPNRKSQTVERAFQLLGFFSKEVVELNTSDFIQRMKLPRTVVVRLLETLLNAGFIERDHRTGYYRIGLRAFEMGSLYVVTNPLLTFISGELERLAETTGYSADFGVIDGPDAVIIAHFVGSLPVRFEWSAGDRLPAASAAFGKAVLLTLEARELDQVLGRGRLQGLTERSPKMRRELDRQLATARTRGWTLAQDESSIGMTAVGAPILEANGKALAGISLSFLNYPPDEKRVETTGILIRETAERISGRIRLYESFGKKLSRSDGRSARQRLTSDVAMLKLTPRS